MSADGKERRGCGRLAIGAAGSGAGKTSVTLGLAAALSARGHRVRCAKTGPDFIDPRYLAAASGREAYNFDPWMTGEGYMLSLAERIGRDCDILLVEGVMGLFDGARPDRLDGSTAHVAFLLGAPVLLVVNARGMSRSLAALAGGFAGFDPRVDVGGVVANFTGGKSHAEALGEALRAAGGPPLMGAVPRNAFRPLSEKRYGLRGDLTPDLLKEMALAAERHVDLDAVLGLAARGGRGVRRPSGAAVPERPSRMRIGIPLDEAFFCYYPDDLEELRASGADIVPFSPLADDSLPGGLDGLHWGGGRPEEWAEGLSANAGMLESVRMFAASGRPVVACGNGCSYFAGEMTLADGGTRGMAGVFPGTYDVGKKLRAIGYLEMEAETDLPVAPRGASWRGHVFSYGELRPGAGAEGWRGAYTATGRRGGIERGGWVRDNVFLSPAHVRFAGEFGIGRRFAAVCGGMR